MALTVQLYSGSRRSLELPDDNNCILFGKPERPVRSTQESFDAYVDALLEREQRKLELLNSCATEYLLTATWQQDLQQFHGVGVYGATRLPEPKSDELILLDAGSLLEVSAQIIEVYHFDHDKRILEVLEADNCFRPLGSANMVATSLPEEDVRTAEFRKLWDQEIKVLTPYKIIHTAAPEGWETQFDEESVN